MSADNGYIIRKCHQSQRYGLFYYNASVDYDDVDYTEGNSEENWIQPINAILYGIKMANESPTEYGVHVDHSVLQDALERWSILQEMVTDV